MKADDLKSVTKKKFKATTNSKHSLPVGPNLLKRNFSVRGRNVVWVTDATYISTRQGWLYLCVYLDLYSRAVVGWQAGNRLTKDLFIEPLGRALSQRKPPEGLIVHSDRGAQYASKDFGGLLKRWGCKQSMSRKGDCWDNSPAESFFATLKRELIYQNDYWTRNTATSALAEYIDEYYNYQRIHSSIGYSTPMRYDLAA